MRDSAVTKASKQQEVIFQESVRMPTGSARFADSETIPKAITQPL